MGDDDVTTEERRPWKGTMWILAGAILIGVGTLLPFANVDLQVTSGDVSASVDEDFNWLDVGSGKLYLAIAIGLVVLAVISLTKAAFLSRILLFIALVAGAATVAGAWIDVSDIEDKTFDSLEEESNVDVPREDLDVGNGIGVYVVLAGGAIAVLGSLRGLVTRRTVTVREDDRD